MSTEDERKDLVANPVPLSPKCEEDAWIPTELYDIDKKMWELESQIRELGMRRAKLLERAIEYNIMTDAHYEIRRVEKNLPRRINMQEFERKMPEAFKLACTIECAERRRKAEELLADADKVTNLKIGTAKALLQDRMIDEICYPHEIAVSYEVQKCQKSKRLKPMP